MKKKRWLGRTEICACGHICQRNDTVIMTQSHVSHLITSRVTAGRCGMRTGQGNCRCRGSIWFVPGYRPAERAAVMQRAAHDRGITQSARGLGGAGSWLAAAELIAASSGRWPAGRGARILFASVLGRCNGHSARWLRARCLPCSEQSEWQREGRAAAAQVSQGRLHSSLAAGLTSHHGTAVVARCSCTGLAPLAPSLLPAALEQIAQPEHPLHMQQGLPAATLSQPRQRQV
jgi:hypothetical protein